MSDNAQGYTIPPQADAGWMARPALRSGGLCSNDPICAQHTPGEAFEARWLDGLGIAGAAWSIATGSPIPATLTAIGAGLGMLPNKAHGGVYSYLFDAQKLLR